MLEYIILSVLSATGGILFSRKFLQKTKVIVEKPDENYIKALNAMTDNDYKTAQELLMETIEDNPENVMAYQRLAELKFKQGNYARALKIFEMVTIRGVISKEELIRAYRWEGRASEKLEKFDKAIEVYNEILDISHEDLETIEKLISLYERNKDWDNALKFLKKKKDITGKSDEINTAYILSCKALDYYNNKNSKEAQKIARDAIDHDELCIFAYVILGDILYNENEIKDAIETWEKVIKLKPGFSYIIFKRLEKAYFETNEYEKMISVYEKIIKNDPKNALASVSLGDLYFNMGEYTNALVEYKESLQKGYITLEIVQNIFKIYKEKDKMEDFADEINFIFSKFENNSSFLCTSCKYTHKEFFWKCPECGKMIYV
ncbi:tetratricopeptide repeat protein [Candidatus Poribacteria bacterium]|nr:tetratricopeptide repeat protein [Candidatus Poribacteria bacterium]